MSEQSTQEIAEAKATLEKLIQHEQLLVLDGFDETAAWNIGSKIRELAAKHDYPIVIDIRKGDDVLFFSALPGTAPTNSDWARRKRNLVNVLHMSSYQVGIRKLLGEDIMANMALNPRDYTPHGGSFPVRIAGSGVVGSISVSGLPQRQDHKIIIDVLADHLGVSLGNSAF